MQKGVRRHLLQRRPCGATCVFRIVGVWRHRAHDPLQCCVGNVGRLVSVQSRIRVGVNAVSEPGWVAIAHGRRARRRNGFGHRRTLR